MKLELIIYELPEDVTAVILDLRIDDHSEADRPARNLATRRIGPLPVGPTVDNPVVDLPDIGSLEQSVTAAINIRATCQRPNGDRLLFVNTAEILVPYNQPPVITAELFRVH